jgi:hypothetical protein
MDDHFVQVGSQKYIKDFQNIFHFIVLNSQIWLKQLMNDRQLGYIKKILFKNLIKFLGFTAGYLSGQKECNSCARKIC